MGSDLGKDTGILIRVHLFRRADLFFETKLGVVADAFNPRNWERQVASELEATLIYRLDS